VPPRERVRHVCDVLAVWVAEHIAGSQGRVECHDCGLNNNGDKNGATNIVKRAVGKNIQSPLSTVGAVVAQPETQVVLKGINGEMEPANSPSDVGLTLSEGSPRVKPWEKSRSILYF